MQAAQIALIAGDDLEIHTGDGVLRSCDAVPAHGTGIRPHQSSVGSHNVRITIFQRGMAVKAEFFDESFGIDLDTGFGGASFG
jgi:hypothetical protein